MLYKCAGRCIENSLDKSLVGGKIVLCDTRNNGSGALSAGAVGMVMQDGGYKDVARHFPLPATYLDLDEGSSVSLYGNTTRYLTIQMHLVWQSAALLELWDGKKP